MCKTIGVIDIGSNTIKLLVAKKSNDHCPIIIKSCVSATRISEGLEKNNSALSNTAMINGCNCVEDLIRQADKYNVEDIFIIATSAVRDAVNRHIFTNKIFNRTGKKVRILTGIEEANYIGRGVLLDPVLKNMHNFFLADIGGGSVELIEFNNKHVKQVISLPLGAVRLTDKFVNNISNKITVDVKESISNHIFHAVNNSLFNLNEINKTLVGTGGSIACCRSMLAKKSGKSLLEFPLLMCIEDLSKLYAELSDLNLKNRCLVPGLSENRADIMPVAILTLITLMKILMAENCMYSQNNLRVGIAAEVLS